MKISLIMGKRLRFKIKQSLVTRRQTTKLFYLKYTVTKMEYRRLMTLSEPSKGKLI